MSPAHHREQTKDSSGDFDMVSRQNMRRQPFNRPRPAVHEMIGHRLRLHYEELHEQPLPSRLADLMQTLDEGGEEPGEPRQV